LEEQIQSLKSERDQLQAKIEKLEKAADGAERDAAILHACEWLSERLCPPRWVEAGKQARRSGYTGATSAWTWIMLTLAAWLLVSILACPLLLLYFIGRVEWVRRRIPSRAEIQRAADQLKEARAEAVTTVSEAEEKAIALVEAAQTVVNSARARHEELMEKNAGLELVISAHEETLKKLEEALDKAQRRRDSLQGLNL